MKKRPRIWKRAGRSMWEGLDGGNGREKLYHYYNRKETPSRLTEKIKVYLFTYIIIYVHDVYMHVYGCHACMWQSEDNSVEPAFFSPLCSFWGLNPGDQTCMTWQALYPLNHIAGPRSHLGGGSSFQTQALSVLRSQTRGRADLPLLCLPDLWANRLWP